MKTEIRILRLREVCQKIGVGRSTIYFWIANGSFPKPLKLSPTSNGAVGWLASDIDQWLETRSASS
ncbi:MAG: hypothetical protein NVS3B3_10110 [Aquirhabdus sp.]